MGTAKKEVQELPEVKALRRAEALITGSRNDDYGSAYDDFELVAQFWTTWLKARGILPLDHPGLSGKDVAMMMALLKARREAGKPKQDNIDDGLGYTALARIWEER
ncbi:MAG: DUF6378 domain-containing protein [Planctomycetota bacterium]|jgi:hypothetical protein